MTHEQKPESGDLWTLEKQEGRVNIPPLPDWPRYMTREVAARYLGVSVDVFDYERSTGWWPPPRIRGPRGGRLTWDRKLLDSYADRDSALVAGAPMAVDAPSSAESGPSPLAEKMNATLAQNRPQRGAQASQRRHHH